MLIPHAAMRRRVRPANATFAGESGRELSHANLRSTAGQQSSWMVMWLMPKSVVDSLSGFRAFL